MRISIRSLFGWLRDLVDPGARWANETHQPLPDED